MCSAQEGTVSDSNAFINVSYPQIKTNAEFDALLKADNEFHKIDNQHASKSYNSEVVQPSAAIHSSPGYQPYEQLRGFIKGESSNTRNSEASLNFQHTGLFGQCSNAGVISFMNTQE